MVNLSNSQNDSESALPSPAAGALSSADLQTLLTVWESATNRLEQTHLVLQEEVRRLTEELEFKNRELSRKNRLADLGQMAAHIAHEVRNGLVPVTVYLSMLKRRHIEDSESTRVIGKMESAFSAVDSIVSDLLQFTAHQPPQRQPTAIRRFCEDLLEPLRANSAAQGVTIEVDASEDIVLSVDSAMLRRALLNLTFNAIDAMPKGGALYVRARQTHENTCIDVVDSGEGIPEDIMPRLFEPFYTTKSSGTGLGLAIVQRICEAHGGTIQVDNAPEGGARFSIQIPTLETTPLQAKEMAA
jgi:signal transduction histidine kinase